MTAELATMLLALGAAVCWGTGDFCGGFAARRMPTAAVVVVAQSLGLVAILAGALLFREPLPGLPDVGWGAAAGVFGVVGALLLYRGLAVGRMGVVAPVAAIVTAVPSIISALFTDGLPGQIQLIGFAVALVAVWLISGGGSKAASASPAELGYAAGAGLGFGMLFIAIDQFSPGTVFWPLVVARVVSVSLMLLLALRRNELRRPTRRLLPALFLAGTLAVVGNALFTVASQLGRLDIAAVVGSLYPAATVLLAWLLLQERLKRSQWLGVGLALAALVLIAL